MHIRAIQGIARTFCSSCVYYELVDLLLASASTSVFVYMCDSMFSSLLDLPHFLTHNFLHVRNYMYSHTVGNPHS